MHQQTDILLYRFRFLFIGIFTIACLLLFSAFVTAAGSHSIGNAKARLSQTTSDTAISDSTNSITAGAYNLVETTKHAALSTSVAFYGACKSVTTVTAQTGKSIGHGSLAVVGGIWGGTRFAVRGVGSGIMFTLHTTGTGVGFVLRVPGKVVGSVAHTNSHVMNAIMRPTDNTPKTVPTIQTESATALLASINEQLQQNRQNFDAQQNAQLAANQQLDGTVVAGDPNHGGYPAKWDAPAPRDSAVDSWGMYNRECVSYTAWKVYQTYGDMPYWGGVGNANEWIGDAKASGIPTSSTPKVHSVAISMQGYYGHAMWVEKVSGDMIYVSQYNYDLQGHYSEMWVNGSSFTYIYFH